MSRRHARWLLPFAAGLGVMVALAVSIPTHPSRASGPSGYFLYYAFNLPQAASNITLSTEEEKKRYSGTLTGTLGGLVLISAKYEYGTGASAGVGGGTFSLTTSAGEVRDGTILMTTDKQQTTLLFFGTYLGSHLAFSIKDAQEQIGGPGQTASGLAETGFVSHAQYLEAVRLAITAIAPPEHDKIIAGAEQNPRLVHDYQQKHPTQ